VNVALLRDGSSNLEVKVKFYEPRTGCTSSPRAKDLAEEEYNEKLCANSLLVKRMEIRKSIMTKTAMTATKISILIRRSLRLEVAADLLALAILSDIPTARGFGSPRGTLFFACTLFRIGIFFG
jgi:hypothetical protein